MIRVEYLGRLGNNLFQWSIARLISERSGILLNAPAIQGFPATSFSYGKRTNFPEYDFYEGNSIPFEELCSPDRQRGTILRGYFQRKEYFYPNQEAIRKWLSFSTDATNIPESIIKSAREGIVLSVRRCDYVELGWALPFCFYEQAIELLRTHKNNRVWIVTDDFRDPFFKNFRKYKPYFFNGSPIQQLYLLTLAQKLVMSQSTFSWWGNFLAEDQTAICPRPSFGCWNGQPPFEDIDLIDEERFRVLPALKPYHPTAEEKRYQMLKRILVRFLRRFPARLKNRL